MELNNQNLSSAKKTKKPMQLHQSPHPTDSKGGFKIIGYGQSNAHLMMTTNKFNFKKVTFNIFITDYSLMSFLSEAHSLVLTHRSPRMIS